MSLNSQAAIWSDMAHKARVAAAEMRDPELRLFMLEVAARYQLMAQRVEEMALPAAPVAPD